MCYKTGQFYSLSTLSFPAKLPLSPFPDVVLHVKGHPQCRQNKQGSHAPSQSRFFVKSGCGVSKDYQTVWQLAHNWVGADPEKSDPHLLPDELKHSIHRLMSAAINQAIPSRTRRFALFLDDSFFTFVFNFRHTRKFLKCLRKDEFDKPYLSSIYLKRGDVLRWCQSEFLSPPPIWQVDHLDTPKFNEQIDDSDDDKSDWYGNLSDRRKQRITCLEIAKQLWKENPELSYKEVHSHPAMTRYGYGKSFTFDTFKKWARPFASESAKQGGKK